MALNSLKYNNLTSLGLKGLRNMHWFVISRQVSCRVLHMQTGCVNITWLISKMTAIDRTGFVQWCEVYNWPCHFAVLVWLACSGDDMGRANVTKEARQV